MNDELRWKINKSLILAELNSPDKTVQNDTSHGVGVTLFRARDFALNYS